MKLYFIRHGQTQGNREGRYVGATDEPLCPDGVEALRLARYPAFSHAWVSPLLRCRQSAELIAPGVRLWIESDFRECDFGDFEYHNYAELNGRPDYQAWIDSGGTLSFPGGESRADFSRRCCAAFERLMDGADFSEDTALIVHGGTIMAILERYGVPKRDYFDYQARNGGLIEALVMPEDWAKKQLRVYM